MNEKNKVVVDVIGESPDFGKSELLPAVVQDIDSGEVLMQAWVNAEAWHRTIHDGVAWFYSRSRRNFWKKGETSGNQLDVFAAVTDCDADTIIYLVRAQGPACHKNTRSCFVHPSKNDRPFHLGLLADLTETIQQRSKDAQKLAASSYVASLLVKGVPGPAAKVREEAEELCNAAADESEQNVIAEAADLLFHMLVLLETRGINIYDVMQELRKREGLSGLTEKAQRNRAN